MSKPDRKRQEKKASAFFDLQRNPGYPISFVIPIRNYPFPKYRPVITALQKSIFRVGQCAGAFPGETVNRRILTPISRKLRQLAWQDRADTTGWNGSGEFSPRESVDSPP